MFDPDRRHLIAYVAAAAVLVVIAARYLGRDSGSPPVPRISMAAPASAKSERARPRAPASVRPQLIWVDVAGAVRRPGLYSLPKGARVAVAIQRAGGVGPHANQAAVNLAAKLADGQQIFVPRLGRGGPTPAAAAAVAVAPAADAGAAPGAAQSTAAPSASAGTGAGQVSLSTASEAELETLDGVGPALAQRIIDYRQQHGGFHSIEELQEVSGIGPKRFAALKNAITP